MRFNFMFLTFGGVFIGFVVGWAVSHDDAKSKVAMMPAPACVAIETHTVETVINTSVPDDELVLLSNRLSTDGTQREITVGSAGANWAKSFATFKGQCKSVELVDCHEEY